MFPKYNEKVFRKLIGPSARKWAWMNFLGMFTSGQSDWQTNACKLCYNIILLYRGYFALMAAR